MDLGVSFYVYIVTGALLVYMLTMLVESVQFIVFTLVHIDQILVDTALHLDAQPDGASLLHSIAFAVVLVKAYRILRSYAETHHVNLKFLIEIAIIAPTIEILFNPNMYAIGIDILFAAFALGSLLIYLIFYKTLKEVSADHENSHIPVHTDKGAAQPR